mmetsp:Transcript_100684/g.173964  ORF Transcript_100684/g.173964 Transcript_100684/m.173964 type:complete len:87 (-) Transcript_100684:135-395(-)
MDPRRIISADALPFHMTNKESQSCCSYLLLSLLLLFRASSQIQEPDFTVGSCWLHSEEERIENGEQCHTLTYNSQNYSTYHSFPMI